MRWTDYSAHAVTERLLDWVEQAGAARRRYRADALLLLAWVAYDRPAKQAERPISTTQPDAARRNRKANVVPVTSNRGFW
jgi:hypothetical protein